MAAGWTEKWGLLDTKPSTSRTLAPLLHNDCRVPRCVSVQALFLFVYLYLSLVRVYHNPWHGRHSPSNYFRHRGTSARTSDWLFVNRIVCQQPLAHYAPGARYAFAKRVARARPFNPRPDCLPPPLLVFFSYLSYFFFFSLSSRFACVRERRRKRKMCTRRACDIAEKSFCRATTWTRELR